MIRSFHFWLINICLSAFFVSCTKEDSSLGLKPENSLLSSTLIDTFDVEMYTVLERENIISHNSVNIIAGKYADPISGVTTANSYFQIVPKTNYGVQSGAVCDSIIICLDISSETIDGETIYGFYGDSTSTLSFGAYQLEEDLLPSTDKIYHTDDVLSFSTTAEGITTPEVIYPGLRDTIAFDLNQTYGQAILDQMIVYGGDNPTFLSVIKGLHLKLEDGFEGACVDFNILSSKTYVKVYYHDAATPSEVEEADLIMYSPAENFNHMEVDLTGTAFSLLSGEGDTLASTLTGNQTLFQSATGLRTMIKIPQLNTLIQQNPHMLINAFTLELKMDSTHTGGFADAPPRDISIFEATNNFIDRDTENYPLFIVNEGDLNVDNAGKDYYEYDPVNYVYKINLGVYLQSFIANGKNEFELVIGSYSESGNIERAILNDTETSISNAKVKLYYTEPNLGD
ncbi:DUF4270 domain-containing protein [Cyclobacteriaceae bacterium]|nr:DUF4270 domain-containing protein [Cyclobacteriaceae bacterium]